ncbi:MAG: hypothetical protein CME65_04890 [Halobacteriovoraceae bacterium]|nr:hypothetical protein [Halobacteriovoraceae bacterium]|tara:strand:+ start:14673 stop:16844 length:2172 start_codon:yes stop_codon:yes gene_type:complete
MSLNLQSSEKFKKTIFLILSSIFILGGLRLGSKTLPFKINELLHSENKIRIQFENYDAEFNNESDFFILYKPKNSGVWRNELKKLQDIFSDHPAVLRLNSLVNAEFLTVQGDYIRLKKFSSYESESTPKINHPFFENLYRSHDKDTFLIHGVFKNFRNIKEERTQIGELLKIIDAQNNQRSIELHAIGTKIAQYYYYLETIKTQMLLTPLLFLLIGLLVFFLFRSFKVVLFFYSIILLSYTSVVYLIVFIEGGISSYSGFAIFFILIVATSDLVHFFHKFLETKTHSLENKLKQTKSAVLKPCLYTSLTTAFCFISLIPNSLRPVSLIGIYASFGSLICFLLTFYGLPFIIRLFEYTPISSNKMMTLNLQWLFKHSLKSPYAIISLFTLLAVIFCFQLPKLKIDDDFYHKFKDTHPLTIAVNSFQNDFQTLGSIDLTYKYLTPSAYKQIVKFEKEIESEIPQVSYTKSYFQMLNYVKDAFHEIPESTLKEKRIESLIELIRSRKIFSQFYSENFERTIVYVKSTSTNDTKLTLKQIENLAKKYSQDFTLTPQGFITLRTYVLHSLIEHFLLSFMASLVLVFAAFYWLFKKFSWAFLAIIPNIFPLIFIGGILSFAGLTVDSNLVLMICISLGIAVDDTIHFLYSLKSNLAHHNMRTSLESAFKSTSKALLGTTLIFALSFPCFFLADLKIFYLSGGFIILSLIFALAADLLLLPAILSLKSRS